MSKQSKYKVGDTFVKIDGLPDVIFEITQVLTLDDVIRYRVYNSYVDFLISEEELDTLYKQLELASYSSDNLKYRPCCGTWVNCDSFVPVHNETVVKPWNGFFLDNNNNLSYYFDGGLLFDYGKIVVDSSLLNPVVIENDDMQDPTYIPGKYYVDTDGDKWLCFDNNPVKFYSPYYDIDGLEDCEIHTLDTLDIVGQAQVAKYTEHDEVYYTDKFSNVGNTYIIERVIVTDKNVYYKLRGKDACIPECDLERVM